METANINLSPDALPLPRGVEMPFKVLADGKTLIWHHFRNGNYATHKQITVDTQDKRKVAQAYLDLILWKQAHAMKENHTKIF
jgi:hypothetical protein